MASNLNRGPISIGAKLGSLLSKLPFFVRQNNPWGYVLITFGPGAGGGTGVGFFDIQTIFQILFHFKNPSKSKCF